eukprot:1191604-Prorocentrum_minimum.AAC.2
MYTFRCHPYLSLGHALLRGHRLEVVVAHHLRLDEALLKVRVNHARRLGGQRAAVHCPRPHLSQCHSATVPQ